MINVPTNARVYILHQPISFHRQIDGLAAAARQMMGKDPVSGAFFVFCSRSKQSIRLLHFDGSGFWLCTKRLSKGSFGPCWPTAAGEYSPLLVQQLQMLLWGRDFVSLQRQSA